MRIALFVVVIAGCTGGGARSGETLRLSGAPALTDVVVQSGLSVPWDVTFVADGRMFVTERMGTILMFASGKPNAKRLASVRVPDVHAMGEAGVMGIVPDAAFATNGFLYACVSRSDNGWVNQLLRYKATADAIEFDGYVIRSGIRAASIHDGCRLAIGPDGRIWMTMGENGDGKLAQDPNSLNGKVLRVNTDGSVPADNPILPGATGRSLVYSMGHRDPQGLALQPGTNVVFEIEQGAVTNDEINILSPGANYGWPDQEGPGGAGRGFTDPIWTSGQVTYAACGATFVHGAQWGSWSGSLFIATLKEQDLRRFEVHGTTVVPKEVLYDQKYGRLRTVTVGPDGALYLTTSNGSGDRIIRVAPQ